MEELEERVEVSFIIPCLNEEESLASVVTEIHDRFSSSGLDYEVIVADNGSTDGSREIAVATGAQVVEVSTRGYGAALLGGIASANGIFCVMGDADGSYPFSDCMPIIEGLRSGSDVVMGNRFRGGIERGAMPWLHRHLGNPVLSAMGRFLFGVPVGDFHCGLRGFRKESIQGLELTSPGMEFASEMLVKAQKSGLRIDEVPVRLRKDLRSRPPHLRTWRDGWRHFRFLLAQSPRWVFLVPALFAATIFLAVLWMALAGPLSTGNVEFSYRTSLVAVAMATISCAAAWAFAIGRALTAARVKHIPYGTESAAGIALLVFLIGSGLVIDQYASWAESGFGELPVGQPLLVTVLGCLLISVGGISFFFALVYGLAKTARS